MATAAEPVLDATNLIKAIRAELGMSQRAYASLLGCSARLVQSVEQGWRRPSAAMERLALMLLVNLRCGAELARPVCWEFKRCPPAWRDQCPSFVHGIGHLCWFLTGTMCDGKPLHSWWEKREVCLRCDLLAAILTQKAPVAQSRR